MQGYILLADGEGAAAQDHPSPWPQFAMPLLLILLFYFVFLKPQQRKEKERRRMIESLRVGAKVVFGAGIVGEIVEAREKTFVIESDGSARMEVLRSAVQELVP